MSEYNVIRLKLRTFFVPLYLATVVPMVVLVYIVGSAGAAAVPPILDLNGDAPGADFSATFTEDEGAEPIVSTTGLMIDNSGDNILTAAKAVLTNRPDATVEFLSAEPGATGLTVKYTVETGELTIKGNASVADYEQVLRTLTYNNSSQSPDTIDRVVVVTVSDGVMTSLPVTSTVAINAVNDAPLLDNTGEMTMAGINEDDQNSNGNSVTGIIKTAEAQGQDRITDVDKNSPEGFAVIEAGSANGVWQFSLDSGISWQPVGSVSNISALLLDGVARIRFVPDLNFNGSASFLFRAWDGSGGRASGSSGIDASLNGGATPFSTELEMVTINILNMNDLPIIDLNGNGAGTDHTAQFYENGAPVPIADANATMTDGDHAQLAKLTITLVNRPNGAAELLSADSTGTNITIAAYIPATGQLVLNGPDSVANFQTVLRRTTYSNSSTNPASVMRTVTVVANDGINDGPVATTMISVNPTNSAPVLDPLAVMALPAIAEDTFQPVGQMISQTLGSAGNPITDADSGSVEGIAVINAAAANGQWQYSLVNPPVGEADWQPVGGVSDTEALLLSDDAWLRFVPAPDYFGESSPLNFRAWDRASGSSGQRVNVSVNGGNTAFSVDTNSFATMITSVNDLPLLGGLPAGPLQYIEDTGPLPLPGESLTVTDIDSPLLASAIVRLTNPLDGDAEWLLVTTNGTGITAVYEGGVLQLTGPASPAAYQAVLRSIKYWNASQDPDPTDRTFQISVADNQGSRSPASIVVQGQPVNDPPELDLNGVGAGENFTTTFFINRGPIAIVAESLVVNDIDNTTIKSATVRIVNLQDDQAELLSADISGVTNIKQSYNPVTGVMSLTGVDSIANYQRVLRTVTYDNILPEPDTTARVAEFTLTDGTSTSEVRQSLVSIAQAASVELYLPLVAWANRRNEEPNDSCAQAYGIGLNIDESFRADDKDDWFFFETTASNVLTVELRNFSPGEGQIVIAAEKSPGQGCGGLQLIGNNGSSATDKIVQLGRRPAGRYYVWVINDGVVDANAAYRLYVRAVP